MSLLPLIERIDRLITDHAPVSDVKALLATLHDTATALESDHSLLTSNHAAFKSHHAKLKEEYATLMDYVANLKKSMRQP